MGEHTQGSASLSVRTRTFLLSGGARRWSYQIKILLMVVVAMVVVVLVVVKGVGANALFFVKLGLGSNRGVYRVFFLWEPPTPGSAPTARPACT